MASCSLVRGVPFISQTLSRNHVVQSVLRKHNTPALRGPLSANVSRSGTETKKGRVRRLRSVCGTNLPMLSC